MRPVELSCSSQNMAATASGSRSIEKRSARTVLRWRRALPRRRRYHPSAMSGSRSRKSMIHFMTQRVVKRSQIGDRMVRTYGVFRFEASDPAAAVRCPAGAVGRRRRSFRRGGSIPLPEGAVETAGNKAREPWCTPIAIVCKYTNSGGNNSCIDRSFGRNTYKLYVGCFICYRSGSALRRRSDALGRFAVRRPGAAGLLDAAEGRIIPKLFGIRLA